MDILLQIDSLQGDKNDKAMKIPSPAIQHEDQVILTCIHFPPPFVLLQHEYLDKVLNAIQQDLLVNLF